VGIISYECVLRKAKVENISKRRKAPAECLSAIKLKPETGGLAACMKTLSGERAKPSS
jgi:hypothetical protein